MWKLHIEWRALPSFFPSIFDNRSKTIVKMLSVLSHLLHLCKRTLIGHSYLGPLKKFIQFSRWFSMQSSVCMCEAVPTSPTVLIGQGFYGTVACCSWKERSFSKEWHFEGPSLVQVFHECTNNICVLSNREDTQSHNNVDSSQIFEIKIWNVKYRKFIIGREKMIDKSFWLQT